MAEIEFMAPVKTVSGDLCGNGMIHRYKHHSDSHIDGKNEIFRREKRDYKKCPLTKGEQACVERFKQADKMMREALRDKSSESYQYWWRRFQQQVKHAEEDAPIDKRTGQRKVYVRLDAYVRAKMMTIQ